MTLLTKPPNTLLDGYLTIVTLSAHTFKLAEASDRFLTMSDPRPYDSSDPIVGFKKGLGDKTMRQLFELQDLDLEIDRCQAERASVDERLRDDSAIVGARAALAEREESVQQARRQHASRSLELDELRDRGQSLEVRMYGGSIRNPRAMEAADGELKMVKERSVEVEEDLLNLMIGQDEKEGLAVKGRAVLTEMEQTRSETVSRLTSERAALEEKAQALGAQRQQQSAAIAPALLSQYEFLRKAHQGRAVASVERGMCTGCRLALPTGELQRVRAGIELVICNSCGRILFLG